MGKASVPDWSPLHLGGTSRSCRLPGICARHGPGGSDGTTLALSLGSALSVGSLTDPVGQREPLSGRPQGFLNDQHRRLVALVVVPSNEPQRSPATETDHQPSGRSGTAAESVDG